MIATPEQRSARHGSPSAETTGEKVAAAAGVVGVAGLRAMPAEMLRDAAAKAGYVPFGTVDGKLLPRQLVDTFDRGEQARVPILAGYNSGEIRTLRFLLPPPTDRASYERRVRASYGALADEYLRLYPAANPEDSALASVRDGMYGWTSQRLALKQQAVGQPAYLYLFDHGWPAADAAGLHGFHAAELPFVFGTQDRTPPGWPKTTGRSIDQRLGEAMINYWVSFVKDGRPAAPDEAAWHRMGDDATFMLFADVPRLGTRPLRGAYPLHEQVMCRSRAAGDVAWGYNVGIAAPSLAPMVAGCP